MPESKILEIKKKKREWISGEIFCVDCGKKITNQATRCGFCANKGVNNPRYKKSLHVDVFCIDCGKKLADKAYYWGYIRCRSCSKKNTWVNNPREGLKGEKNSNWRGGTTFEPYPIGWNKTFKEQIRYRDSYKCQNCSMSEVEHCKPLHVHHIDYDKKNISENNLITLCNRCHSKTNHNRDYWIKYFTTE